MQSKNASVWKIWIDTGGTFTDCIAIDSDKKFHTVKVLSNSSLRGKITGSKSNERTYTIEQDWQAPDDFIKGFDFRLLSETQRQAKVTAYDSTDSTITLDRPIPINNGETVSFEVLSDEEAPVLAMRLATKTTLQEELPPIDLRLATTKATNALLEKKGVPTALFVTEGFKDLLNIGTQERPDLFALEIEKRTPIYEKAIEVKERLDADGDVLKMLDLSSLETKVEKLLDKGI